MFDVFVGLGSTQVTTPVGYNSCMSSPQQYLEGVPGCSSVRWKEPCSSNNPSKKKRLGCKGDTKPDRCEGKCSASFPGGKHG